MIINIAFGAVRLSGSDASQGNYYSHVVALIRPMSLVLVVVVFQEADSHEGKNVKKKKKFLLRFSLVTGHLRPN